MATNAAALCISPKYTSLDWDSLNPDQPADWKRASEILRDQLYGRFLKFADGCLTDPFSGFVVLAIDSLLVETIAQFQSGETDGHGKSEKYTKQFLTGPRFQPYFDQHARVRFYKDIRCGLLHQAEAKEMWLVRRRQSAMLMKIEEGRGYIIDVERFHAAVRQSLDDYCGNLENPKEESLRKNLWRKMGVICRVRTARGLLYDASSAPLAARPQSSGLKDSSKAKS